MDSTYTHWLCFKYVLIFSFVNSGHEMPAPLQSVCLFRYESSFVRAATVLDFIGHDTKSQDLPQNNDKSRVIALYNAPNLIQALEAK